ncbi:MAG: hypothetical protein HY430_03525 [Candidatus Levybacteria bacterium]|nr:hypothetical protein [Candidatus Levybacteria bacterium]
MPEMQQPTQLSQNPTSSSPAGIHVRKKTFLALMAVLLLCAFVIVVYLNINLIRTFFGLNISAVSEVPGYTFTIENKKALIDYFIKYNFSNRNVVVFEEKTTVRPPATVVFKLAPQTQPYNKLFGGKSKTPVSTIGEHYNAKTKELTVAIHIDSESLKSLPVSNLSFIASSEIIFFLYQITQGNPSSDMREVSQIRDQINKDLVDKKLPIFQVKKQ